MRRLLLLSLLSGLSTVLAASPDLSGLYSTDRDGTSVEIFRCGVAYCGKLVAFSPLQEHRIKDFTPIEKRRPGMKMLWNIQPTSTGAFKGQIYSPQDGRIFYCRISAAGTELKVRQSMDPWGIIGKTRVWNRI